MLARTGAVLNARQKMGGLALLRSLEPETARLAFFDPQYRAVLDKQAYGNEGARQKARAKLPQMTEAQIATFVQEIERVLLPSGYLMLWIDKFMLCEGRHRDAMRYAGKLQLVDLLHWNKVRLGMGRRFRCKSEYLVVIQKQPIKGNWTDHRITDAWTEMIDPAVHAHAKPRYLTERIIRATTKPRDLVVDPCAGGYGVLDACKASNRNFVGCDLL